MACSTLFSALYFLLAYRHGFFITPDGQNYWEGGTSLMQGRGFRTLGGEAITGFPPAFALWVSAWLHLPLAGSSAIWCMLLASTLALAALSGLALACLCDGAWTPVLIAIGAATNVLGLLDGQLLSETLFYPLVFAAYVLYLRDLRTGTDSRLAVAALTSAAIVVRNTGAGYAAGFCTAYFIALDGFRPRGRTLAILILPALLFVLNGFAFHQFASHQVEPRRWQEILQRGVFQATGDISTLGTTAFAARIPTLVQCAFTLLFLGCAARFAGSRAILPMLLSVAGVFVIWAMTPVDPFRIRFSLPLVWLAGLGVALGVHHLLRRHCLAVAVAVVPAVFSIYTALVINDALPRLSFGSVGLGKEMCPYDLESRYAQCFHRQYHVPSALPENR